MNAFSGRYRVKQYDGQRPAPGATPAGGGRLGGFTLVEMLVVVAILAVLVGILLPSLSSARQHTYSVKCATNLKQIGTGWAIYAQNNDETCVPGRMPDYGALHGYPSLRNVYWVGNGDQYRPRWFIQLGAEAEAYPYDKPSADAADDNTKQVDNDLFLCPTRSEWTNNRNYAYGYNYQFLGNARLRLSATSPFDHINYPVRTTFITHGGSTVVAADALGTAATYAEAERTRYNETGVDNNLTDLGNHGWSLDPPRLTTTGDFCDGDNRGTARSAPDARHEDQANFLFADTHVEPLAPEKVGYVRTDLDAYVMPGVSYQGQFPHNRSFSGTGQDADPPPIQ